MPICCAGISTSSSASTSQRRKDSYAPVLRSISTRISASSWILFFVADANACSRETKTISLETFFSRASASTSNNSSRLIPTPSLSNPKLRHEPDPIELGQGKAALAGLGLDAHLVVGQAEQHAAEIALIAEGDPRAQLHFLAGKALEVGRLLERTVESGRRHLEAVVIDSLDGEKPRQMVADGRAIVDADARRRIDEDAQQASPRTRLEIDEFVTQSLHRLFDQFDQLHPVHK